MNSLLHTPWSDEITLIWVEEPQAASGFSGAIRLSCATGKTASASRSSTGP